MAVVTIMTGAIVERVSSIHYKPTNGTTTAFPATTAAATGASVSSSTHAVASAYDEDVLRWSKLEGEDPDLVALKAISFCR